MTNMKIGVLTYHSSHNYGAFLQSYCLASFLQGQTDNEVEIINFEMEKSHSAKINIKCDHERFSVTGIAFNQKRFKMFYKALEDNPFIKQPLFYTDDLFEFSKWLDEQHFDEIIVGSDEVWKLDGYRGFPNPYWLPDIIGCKKIAYAASSRTCKSVINQGMRELIKRYLSDFDYIGVRDKVTQQMLDNIVEGEQKIELNCDPTFLHDFEIDKGTAREFVKKKYHLSGKKKVIGIMCSSTKMAKNILRLYSREFDFVPLYMYYSGCKGAFVPDPFDWMKAIAGCDGLITTFFHGMVFAIKNETPFIALEMRNLHGVEYSKTYDLLYRNGVGDNFVQISGNELEVALKDVGSFLSKVVSDNYQVDYQHIIINEKILADTFISILQNRKQYGCLTVVSKKKSECCGCGECATVCAHSAISMEPDSLGFLYPKIDETICIKCSACLTQCSFKQKIYSSLNETLIAYGAKIKDENARASSRSGGIFTAISDWILEQGGVVYGAQMNSDFSVHHSRATTTEERNAFRGSKYVQSETTAIYKCIKNDLESGKKVLVTGTPCQIGAVKSYFTQNKQKDNLYLAEILCHGVPSPTAFKQYIEYEQCRYKGKISNFDFRDKGKYGWHSHIESFNVGEEWMGIRDWTNLFYSNVFYRDSCYHCPYKKVTRVADITLGDFWGIDRINRSFNDDKGVSLIYVNNSKGADLFSAVQEKIEHFNAPLLLTLRPAMKHSEVAPYYRNEIIKCFEKNGVAQCIRIINKKNEAPITSKLYHGTKKVAKKIMRR